MVFGPSTVVGEPSGMPGKLRVFVECWSCKRSREVCAKKLCEGKIGICKKCADTRKGVQRKGVPW
jgi:hypothetical protein